MPMAGKSRGDKFIQDGSHLVRQEMERRFLERRLRALEE
jgi:hypothetical protein